MMADPIVNQCYGSHLCGVCQDNITYAKLLIEFDAIDLIKEPQIPHNFLTIEEFEDERIRCKLAMGMAQYIMRLRMEERDEIMNKHRPWGWSSGPTTTYPNTAENCKMLGIPRIVEEQECIECGSLFAGASSSDYCESCIRDAANIADVDYVSTKCKGLRELGKEDWERIHGKGTFEYKEIPD